MLPQEHRLRHSADIQRVKQSGVSQRHRLVILLTQENERGVSRFGFIASKRVGTAVARNRARRLIREAIRLHLDEIAIGKDFLFIARQTTPSATYTEVETAVLKLLRRANVLKISS